LAFLSDNCDNLNDLQNWIPDAMDVQEVDDQRSAALRDTLKRYFMNEGFLEWQVNRDGSL
jgi:hypothetical protein